GRGQRLAAVLLAGAVSAAAAEEALVATVPVSAESSGDAAAEAAAIPPQGAIGEVIVTARRRAERALDVPLSLAVLGGEALAEAGLTLPTDIQERVPGLVVSVPNARLTSYTIRGLGSSSANDGIESSVGLFLDGVYLGRQGLSIFDLIDLDRVEVLRGPQGTLFGKNTTAGAINIVTKLPKHTDELELEGTLGSESARNVRASVNGSLVEDRLAARLSGYWSQRDGMIDNVQNGDELNDRNKYGLRGQVLWTPRETLSARFIAEWGRNHEVCCAFPLRDPVRATVQARDDFMEYARIGTDPYSREADLDAPTRSDMRQHAESAEVNWDVSEAHRLTSVTAYRDWRFVPLNDDGTSLELASTSTLNRHRQVSQEVRIASGFDRFDSVVGVFYLHQHLRGLERVILGEDLVGWVFGGLIRERVLPFATETTTGPALYAAIPPRSLDGMTVDTRYRQDSDSVAGFGSIDWHLTDALDLTTGFRYTYEWKDASVDRTRYGGDPDASVLAVGDPFLPILDAALGTDVASLGFNGILDDVAGGEYARDTKNREGNFSGQVALTYQLSEDANLYGSVSRGYKGGGINLGFTGESITPTFDPEQATSYELGAKAQFFERLATATFAVYQTDVRDYQALTFDNEQTLLPNPRQINLLNVGKVRLRGAELEGTGVVARGLFLRAGVAYSDAVTTRFPNAPNEDTRENDKDLSGERLYNAPHWTGNVGAEAHVPWRDWEGVAGVDYAYKSGYWGTVEHGRASYIEGYGLLNARAGVRAGDGGWDVSLWVRNVLDEDYIAAIYPLYGVGDYSAIVGDPRTWGVTLRIDLQ
ncbi:MAG TPA: TonB-dependent receptor, partial [Nevskiaceae bacterium]|nr:TonB-dependent receptor [Nevskiaceae bacterium]